VTGERIGSTDLHNRYLAWAASADAPSLSFKEIKRFMSNIGYPAKRSDGICYLDVAFAADYPSLLDNFPYNLLVADGDASEIADRLDAMIVELSRIRNAVAAAPRSH
jgi:hypothetical protein